MKNLLVMMALILSVLSGTAQYKKASFFTKTGRTYGLGSSSHFMGDGKGTPIGYYFSAGSDNSDKHFFQWYEIELIPAYKYSFNTTALNYNTMQEENVTVSGKSKLQLLYNFNVGYHFLNRSEGTKRVQPFVYAGFHVVILGRANSPEYNGTYDNYKKNVATEGLGLGVRGGTGSIFEITDKIAIKVLAGYNYVYNYSSESYGEGTTLYHMFTSHPYATAGIQFKLLQD